MYNESTPTTKTNPMIVDMNGFNLNVAAESDNKIADAVYVGNNDYITVKMMRERKSASLPPIQIPVLPTAFSLRGIPI